MANLLEEKSQLENHQSESIDKSPDDLDDPNTASGKKYLALQQQVSLHESHYLKTRLLYILFCRLKLMKFSTDCYEILKILIHLCLNVLLKVYKQPDMYISK